MRTPWKDFLKMIESLELILMEGIQKRGDAQGSGQERVN